MPFINTEHGYIFDAPVDRLINGMKYGQQLRMDLQRAADEHQAYVTNQMVHNRNMSVQALMEEQKVRGAGGIPTQNGMVEEPGAPQMLPGMVGQTLPGPSVLRKAGGQGRYIVKLPDAQGGTTQYEMPSPEEQRQRLLQERIEDITAKEHATASPITTPPHLRALGLPPEIWVPNAHLYQYANVTGQLQPTPTPQTYQEMGGAAEVPQSQIPNVMRTVTQAAGQKAAQQNVEAQIKSREKVAGQGITSREKVAGESQAAQDKRAAQRNATTLEAAGIRRDQPTAGQAAVEGRFDVRRQDAAKKQMADVQTKEDALHAQRLQLGSMLNDPNTKDADRQAATSKLKATSFQIQAFQYRKAAILGAPVPPKAIQDQIPEGHQAPTADGHVWAKKDGIVYILK